MPHPIKICVSFEAHYWRAKGDAPSSIMRRLDAQVASLTEGDNPRAISARETAKTCSHQYIRSRYISTTKHLRGSQDGLQGHLSSRSYADSAVTLTGRCKGASTKSSFELPRTLFVQRHRRIQHHRIYKQALKILCAASNATRASSRLPKTPMYRLAPLDASRKHKEVIYQKDCKQQLKQGKAHLHL